MGPEPFPIDWSLHFREVEDKNMTRLLLFVLVSMTAAFPCRDPRVRSAVIGGDVIQATVFRKPGKPRKFAQVELYGGDKIIWTGTTDKNGTFTINHLQHGRYRLSVAGWGSAAVELNPKFDELSNHQRPFYSLLLFDHACVDVTEVVN
jgi:hypothetical protein